MLHLVAAIGPGPRPVSHPFEGTLPLRRRHVAPAIAKLLTTILIEPLEIPIVLPDTLALIGGEIAVNLPTLADEIAAICVEVPPALEALLCRLALVG